MLQALRKHDPKEAQRILSSLTAELLPNPDVGQPVKRSGIDPDLYSEVWKEIRRTIKVGPSDASPDMRGKIFEFLFTQMSQLALPQSGLESVKAKLSFRGELRSDLYDIEFDPFFRISEAHGVRRNHVVEAIRNANDVEHLNAVDNEILLSIFLRTHRDTAGSDPFSLLIIALRKKDKLEVSTGMRIYQSDVDLSAAQRPLDVLRLVVGKYGFLITIGHITSKLIIDETTGIEGPIDADTLVKVHALEGATIFGDVTIRKRKLHNSYGIGLAFALDQTKYATDLRKHGVHVEMRDFRKPTLFVSPAE